MPRSLKKGPYIDPKLEKKVREMDNERKKKVIKTWSRRSTISPMFVGHTFGSQVKVRARRRRPRRCTTPRSGSKTV